jgi:trans-o-hydroxybenzylidenepyruvate hydratase-aldolase
MLRITAKDISGLVTYPPTPCKEGAGGWDVADSVDYGKAATMANLLIDSGTSVLGLCGTTGENAALLWEEKIKYFATMVETVNHRIPIFAGCTSLGTKETVRQMRAVRDLGAEGCFIGLPLWQSPTLEAQVQWYSDLSEAVPEMGIMVYSNQMFFKSDFDTDFWEGIAKRAPNVVTNKAGGAPNIAEHLAAAGHQVNFVPISSAFLAMDKLAPGKFNACWNTTFAPEPIAAFIETFNNGDRARADEIMGDIRNADTSNTFGRTQGPAAAEGYKIYSSRMLSEFAHYNAQVHKVEWNASDYLPGGIGPFRAPYTDFPDDWSEIMVEHAHSWMAMRQKYVKAPAK